ncbi:zinc finger protein 398 [Alligator mississippiensis]|uniref:Zinc finger protein 398 n=2 Tax=Alligator mississippiensis TaxID=8496 RepID=A0A151N905_ALLMI|nr:zinc finger protein 398 [Alligator mississippiensis]
MAEWAPAQASEWEAELQAPGMPEVSFVKDAQLQTAAISLWTVVAAVQAVERKVEAHAARLLNLERRSGVTEKRVVDCEKTMVEFGNQLEGKWAVLGTLIQEYGQLQRRLESMESLLRSRNFWVVRVPSAGKGEDPKVPVAFDEASVQFPREKWENLEDWQKELYKNALKGSYEPSISVDHTISKPDILSRVEPGEEPHIREQQDLEVREVPTGPSAGVAHHDFLPVPPDASCTQPSTESSVSTTEIISWIKREEELSVRAQGHSKEPDVHKSTSTTDDGILIKHEKPPQEKGPMHQEPTLPLPGRLEAHVFPEAGHENQPSSSPQPLSSQTPAAGRLGECTQGEAEFGQFSSAAAQPGSHADETPYLCSECGRSFSREDAFLSHQSAHAGTAPAPCPEGEKPFAPSADMGSHARIISGERPCTCPQCGKTFPHPSQLASHTRAHASESPYPCPECGKSFSLKLSLLLHQRNHTRDRPYQCSECGVHFNGHSGLLRHQMIHTGERPYKCPDCGKGFLRKEHLLNHQRLHTGERPFQCAACGKSFIRKHHLLKHQRIHTGERPYQCAECEKSFRYKQSLKDHLRTHSAEQGQADTSHTLLQDIEAGLLDVKLENAW